MLAAGRPRTGGHPVRRSPDDGTVRGRYAGSMQDPRPSRLPSLGTRGEGWVALQGVLLVAVAFAGVAGPPWPDGDGTWRPAAAGLLGAAGLVLSLGGMRGLGSALTPFPRPVPDGALIEHGVYRLVRHPIYGGVLLLAAGWALWRSPLALVPTALLALLFEGKRRREEAWLMERYPGYATYRARVRRRFIPFVW